MEKKDYLLREIEKIGALLKMIFSKMSGNEVSDAIAIEDQFEEAKGILLNEIGFDIDLFLTLKNSEIEQYISKFVGLNSTNIELLADVFKEVGIETESPDSRQYLECALRLYDFSILSDKTYSFGREEKITEIKSFLS